jgi:hypothetical protein
MAKIAFSPVTDPLPIGAPEAAGPALVGGGGQTRAKTPHAKMRVPALPTNPLQGPTYRGPSGA